jgi:hypothetical protein
MPRAIRGMAAVACVYGAAGIRVYSVSRAAMLGRASGGRWPSCPPTQRGTPSSWGGRSQVSARHRLQCSGTPFTTYGHLEKELLPLSYAHLARDGDDPLSATAAGSATATPGGEGRQR